MVYTLVYIYTSYLGDTAESARGERRKGTGNGNAITVSLTAEEKVLLDRILAVDEASGESMSCLTDEEQEVLTHCLYKLHREALTRIALHTHPLPDTYAVKLGLSEYEA